jgi:hypothetical protein
MNYDHDDVIECPKCSGDIRIIHTICPHCGLNLYPNDWDHQALINEDDSRSLSLSVLAIFVGWLAGGVFTFILHFLLKNWINAFVNHQFIISSISVLGGLLSGMVTGFVIDEKPAWHGIFVGFLTVGTGILFDFYWDNASEEGFINVGSVITWVIIMFFVIGGCIIVYHHPFKAKPYEFPEDEYSIYRELLSRVQNDPSTVERLIDFERQKSPSVDQIVLLKNALQRWKRDNRL